MVINLWQIGQYVPAWASFTELQLIIIQIQTPGGRQLSLCMANLFVEMTLSALFLFGECIYISHVIVTIVIPWMSLFFNSGFCVVQHSSYFLCLLVIIHVFKEFQGSALMRKHTFCREVKWNQGSDCFQLREHSIYFYIIY